MPPGLMGVEQSAADGWDSPGRLRVPLAWQHHCRQGWVLGALCCSWGSPEFVCRARRLCSIPRRCRIAAAAVYYSVACSQSPALVSQVLALCGLLHESLPSCPFSWQGRQGPAFVCMSPGLALAARLSSPLDCAGFFPNASAACPAAVPMSQSPPAAPVLPVSCCSAPSLALLLLSAALASSSSCELSQARVWSSPCASFRNVSVRLAQEQAVHDKAFQACYDFF